MGSLTEALFKAGLVTERKRDRTIADEKEQQDRKTGQHLAKLSTKSGRPAHLDGLKCCGSVGEFKNITKGLLTEDKGIDHMKEVIELAHRFKGQPGGKKLVWLLYQIRDLFPKVKLEDRERFLKRALRKTGATVELLS